MAGVWEVPRNRAAVSAFMKRMLAYSARKNSAKGPPAYSTLKPETSSDSPSARSNGDRLVSARVDTNHIPAKGQAGKTSHMFSWAVAKTCREKAPAKMMIERRMSPRLTS